MRHILLAFLLAIASCKGDDTTDPPSGDPQRGDSSTTGDSSQGDPLAGDPTAGDPIAGDAHAGDPTGQGDPVAGDPVAGDPISGDPPAGDPISGDPPAGDPISGDPPAGDPIPGDPLAGDPAGDPEPEFRVQRGTAVIVDGATTVTLTAAVDYEAPSGPAFVRLVGTRLTGMGRTASGGNQAPDRWMVWVDGNAPVSDSMTFQRFASSADCRVAWELIEYIGDSAGANTMVVHAADVAPFGTSDFVVSSATVLSVADSADVIVFVTGQAVDSGSRADAALGLVTAAWVTDEAQLTRSASGEAAMASYAVVELTGTNWWVGRVERGHATAGVPETTTIADIGDVSRAFLHVQFRTSDTSVDGLGGESWLSATDEISSLLDSGASTTNASTVAWVVSHADTRPAGMRVEHFSGVRSDGAAEEDIWTDTLTQAVVDMETTSILGESARTDGTGDNTPRGSISLQLTATDRVELRQSESSGQRDYRFSVVQWPWR